MSQTKDSLAESEVSLPLPFCFIQASIGLEEAHPSWGELSPLFSLLIQLLISPR